MTNISVAGPSKEPIIRPGAVLVRPTHYTNNDLAPRKLLTSQEPQWASS